ncbi:hypothetical protein HCG51_10600 [Tolypothrix sp. PCC 7910]|uniref:hypothetical protein n=1 Tax=Tolypothrix sp. PCC 7910 TaxID=2099387 RepID=UPI0014278936|nr:hypothetical protein [Tolypothrix sp. PCC 7910]QIR37130.1 hypothetical protein HCG51_10600 [Tolypothrix sp. PCC 7910]
MNRKFIGSQSEVKGGKVLQLKGSCSVEEVLTRQQAALRLEPQISERQLRTYLDLASLYLPSFAEFRDEENGGLNRHVKLTNWHLPVLQQIRTCVLLKGLIKTAVELKQHPEKFTGV